MQILPSPQEAPTLPPPFPQAPVAPQCALLVSGSTQVPSQLICPLGHETRQEPALQTLPEAHVVPAVPPPLPQAPLAPQLPWLVSGSMQVPPQLICVPGQET